MRRRDRWVMAVLGGALALSAGVPAISTVFARGADQAAAAALDDEADEGDDEPGGEAGRDGPPPWAHGHHAKADKAAKAVAQGKSLTAWKAMTPAQREATMARLVREHDEGMKKFSVCREAERDNCVKPLPPGLAKRG